MCLDVSANYTTIHNHRYESRFGRGHTLPTTEADIIADYGPEDYTLDAEMHTYSESDNDESDHCDFEYMPSTVHEPIEIDDEPNAIQETYGAEPESSVKKLRIRRHKDMYHCPRCDRKFSSVATVNRHYKSSCLDFVYRRQKSIDLALPQFKKRQVQLLTNSELNQLHHANHRGRHRVEIETSRHSAHREILAKSKDPRDETYLPFLKEFVAEHRLWLPIFEWERSIESFHQSQHVPVHAPTSNDDKSCRHHESDDDSSNVSLNHRESVISPSVASPPDFVVDGHQTGDGVELLTNEMLVVDSHAAFDLDKAFAEFDQWDKAFRQRPRYEFHTQDK